MFVVSLRYLKPLEEIDRHLQAHREFLARYYDENVFICSGGRKPRTGGIILARGVSRERLAELLREDPFSVHGLAEYEIAEFTPTKYAEAFACFLE